MSFFKLKPYTIFLNQYKRERMKKKFKLLVLGIFGIILLSGCAHKIKIDPNLDEIRTERVNKVKNINVAYYISDLQKNKEVITPGGGGDKVQYTPYKDTEGALNTILSKVFKGVYSLPSLDDKAFISQNNIKYIFMPTIKTGSSSNSPFTWPPTSFTFELECKAVNMRGKKIWSEKVTSLGHAEFDEFKNNFSLSAQRATEKVFKQMLKKLVQTNKF